MIAALRFFDTNYFESIKQTIATKLQWNTINFFLRYYKSLDILHNLEAAI